MSIPDRFFRIAKHKLGEIKDRFDQWDEEALEEAEQKRRQQQTRTDARRELEDSLTDSAPAGAPSGERSAVPVQPPPARRTPEEIARGSRSFPPMNAPSPYTTNAPPPSVSGSAYTSVSPTSDPLLPHYRLLGVEPGADFTVVQSEYNKLAARSDPSRFPAGSEEERQAKSIRERLDASYKVLRDALDPMALRFDRLEFDSPKPPPSESPSPDPSAKKPSMLEL